MPFITANCMNAMVITGIMQQEQDSNLNTQYNVKEDKKRPEQIKRKASLKSESILRVHRRCAGVQ